MTRPPHADARSRTGGTAEASVCLREALALHEKLRLPASHPARVRAGVLAPLLGPREDPRQQAADEARSGEAD